MHKPLHPPMTYPEALFSIAVLNNNMNKYFTQNMGFLSASDWFKLLIIFMSYLRVRVIPNNSLTSEDVCDLRRFLELKLS